MNRKELLQDLKLSLENLKKATHFEQLTKGLSEISNTLNNLYKINKENIDKSNPNKGGMSYYVTKLKNLREIPLHHTGENVLRACWDLYRLSLKTGRWSSLSKLLKIMRESAEYALSLWTFCFAYKVITEDGKNLRNADHATDYWEKNQKSMIKDLCEGYTKSNINEELNLGIGSRGFGVKVLYYVREIGYFCNPNDPRFSKTLGFSWFANAISSGPGWIKEAENTTNFY